jgi:hypothetical protein
MIACGHGHDRFTRGQGKVRRCRIVPARRQDVHQRRQHEHDRDEGGDPPGRVTDDSAEPEPEQTHNRQVEGGTEEGTCNTRVGERRVDVMPRQDPLADEERDQHRRNHQRSGDEPVDQSLGPQDRQPLRHRGHRRADHPRRVLAGDDEDAEDSDRELRELDADKVDLEWVEVRLLLKAHARVVMRDNGTGKRREADREQHCRGE